MTIICKPPGRGNWNPLFIKITGRLTHPDLFLFQVGQVIRFGPMTLRILGVEP